MSSAEPDPRGRAGEAPTMPPAPPPFDPDLSLITELEKGARGPEEATAAG